MTTAAWIKMRTNLWDDPRVSRLCDLTGASEAAIVGSLYWVWATADEHSVDGVLHGQSLASIDRKTRIKGLAVALVDVGWIEDTANGVRIARFDEHNGASAKRRSLDAQTKANRRHVVEGMSAPDADICQTLTGHDAVLEEEEERDKKKDIAPSELPPLRVEPPPAFDGRNAEALNGKAVVSLSPQWELPEAWGVDAEALGWMPREVLFEAEKFRQYWTAGKGSGTRRGVKSWRQSWSTWLGKAAERKR